MSKELHNFTFEYVTCFPEVPVKKSVCARVRPLSYQHFSIKNSHWHNLKIVKIFIFKYGKSVNVKHITQHKEAFNQKNHRLLVGLRMAAMECRHPFRRLVAVNWFAQ